MWHSTNADNRNSASFSRIWHYVEIIIHTYISTKSSPLFLFSLLRLGFSTYYGVMCTPIEKNGSFFVKPRPLSPYTGIGRNVDWQRAAAAELPRHGGGYSVTGDQRWSYVSFPSSWVVEGRIRWYIRRGQCARRKYTLRGSQKRPELPHTSKMEKCIAV